MPERELREAIKEAGITDVSTIAMILAQCHHESGGFKRLEENLNYSKAGLLNTFWRYFNGADAIKYARKPMMIANRVYANRMDNGDEASGDGWKYRGRGFIQLTGKSNYTAASKALGVDYLNNPDYLFVPKHAARCALWFLMKYLPGFRFHAKQGDVKACTLQINGGYNGLEDRIKLYHKYLNQLKAQS